VKFPKITLRREDFSEVDGAWMDRLLRPLNTQFQALQSILNAGLVFGDNVQGFTKEVTTANASTSSASSAASGWTVVGATGSPAFQNSWVASGGAYFAPAYLRKSDGTVMLRGSAMSGTVGTVAFTLPAGFRPSQTRAFPLACGLAAYAAIDSGGNVTISGDAGISAAGVSLDAVQFPADDAPSSSSSSLFPLKFKNDLPGQRRPTSVMLVSAVDTTGNTAVPVSASNPAWTTSGDQVVVNDVAGLSAGRRYRLQFRIE